MSAIPQTLPVLDNCNCGVVSATCKKTRVLALDISTKTGWALFEDGKLLDFGLTRILKKIDEYGEYPWSYRNMAVFLTSLLIQKIVDTYPDVIVIEETNGSKSRYTQKALEFLHCELLCGIDMVKSAYPGIAGFNSVKYVNSSEWRKVLGLALSKEQKKANAKLSKAAREANGQKIDKAALGIKGKITKKHLSVAYANATYNLTLKIKDNDIADAICLGTAFIKGAAVCDGK